MPAERVNKQIVGRDLPSGALAGALCGLLPAALSGLLPAALAAQPNILIVIADDVGVDKVSGYAADYPGYAAEAPFLPDTPTVDSLAAAGLRFTAAWATPLCSPTRAGVLTGRTAFRTGVGSTIPNSQTLNPNSETTLADLLTDPSAGPTPYTAGMIGKWHLGTTGAAGTTDWETGDAVHRTIGDTAHPLRAGFDEYRGRLDGTPPDYLGWTRVIAQASGPASADWTSSYVVDVEADDAVDWVDEQRGPWLEVLAFSASHADGADEGSEAFEADDIGPDCTVPTCLSAGTCTSTSKPAYRGLTECLDHALASVLEGMDEDTLANTLVVFLGDNGTPRSVMEQAFEQTGSRTENGKGSIYETGVHVPLIVADGANWLEWRACTAGQQRAGTCLLTDGLIAQPGRVVTSPVSTLDLYATIADATGFTQTTANDSVSFYGCFNDPSETCATPDSGDRPLYTEFFDYYGEPEDGVDSNVLTAGQAAVRLGPMKLVMMLDEPLHCFHRELYDLDLDPFEYTNLLDDPAYAERLTELTDALTELGPEWILEREFCE